jgi:hypothetical protein
VERHFWIWSGGLRIRSQLGQRGVGEMRMGMRMDRKRGDVKERCREDGWGRSR